MTVPSPVVLVGVGEMGGVFAKAFLGAGVPVYPAVRGTDLAGLAGEVPAPSLVLVTVGEADLHNVLASIPESWRDRVGLIQNELLPRDWITHDIADPTVAVVWFEKKPGRDVKVIIPTPVAGPMATLVTEALEGVGIASTIAEDDDAILQALVVKNVYILTANIAGLETGGSVSEMWADHNELARAVAGEVIEIQRWLTGRDLADEVLIEGMLEAFGGDPDHGTTGRSAPSRLRRALSHAAEAEIEVPNLRAIADTHLEEPSCQQAGEISDS